MKYNATLLISVLLLFTISLGYSQKNITGLVTDQEGTPITGVNIKIKNTNKGVVTDFDGNYSITVNENDILIFSYVGYKTQEVSVLNQTKINLQLTQSQESLDEVVITAQGYKKSIKSLGYAVSTIKSEQVEDRPESDVSRLLAGKVSGVNVVGTGGLAGSGTNIVIRGQSSINQNNQALYVVDGIPFNTAANIQSADGEDFGNGNSVTSSRALDIDPNNIEKVTVLKGLSATVLYGEAGRNGVILITTKNKNPGLSKRKFEMGVSQSVFFSEISGLPDYQNSYGQGGNNNENVAFVGNWGARFDRGITVRHHYDLARLANSFPQFQGVSVPYQAFEDNVKDFFRRGISETISGFVSQSSDKTSLRANFTRTDEDSFVPGNNLKKLNFSLGGNVKLSNNFKMSASFNYVDTQFKTPPVAASAAVDGVSIFQRTLFIPRNLDLSGLPFQDPVTGASVYYRTDQENPRWLVNNSGFTQNVKRFFNSINLSYNFTPNISLTYRLGYDIYTEEQSYFINRGGISSLQARQGYYRTTSGTNEIWDHSFIFNGDFKITDQIGLSTIAGINARGDYYEQTGLVSTQQLVFGFIDHNNFISQSNVDPLSPNFNLDFIEERNTIGLYGQLEFDYSKFLFLNLSGRNDWGSTVEQQNRSLFYPGASLSFIPTTAFSELRSQTLSYLKFRLGYGTSAGFPEPYLTRPTLSIVTNAFNNGNVVSTNTIRNVLENPDLKPELHREVELGLDADLFGSSVKLRTSAYRRISEDQIIEQRLDPSTGFTETTVNVGEVENKGIEIDLGISPFKSIDGISWDTNFLFNAYETTVNELPEGTDQILIEGFSNLGNVAQEGEPLGAIIGSFAVRDEEGNLLIDPNDGTLIESSDVGLENKIIGDPNPDWTLSVINKLSYKGVTLSAQLEYTHGGDVYSTTVGNLLRRGITKDTEAGRENLQIIDGVLGDLQTGQALLDGDGNKIRNSFQLDANDIYFLNFVDPDDQLIFDASVFRIREVSLGYSFPKKYLKDTPFGSLSFSVVGQNLFFWTPNIPKYTNFDPETISTGVGNGRGLDFQTTPNARKFGFNFKATF